MTIVKRLFLALSISVLTGCGLSSSSGENVYSASGEVVSEVEDDPTQFSDGDSKSVSADEADASIVLNGSTGTISDETCGTSGSVVTITKKGKYHVTGSSQNVTIKIAESSESGNIYLILDNVTMTHSLFACIYVSQADKVILQNVGTSSITSTYSESQTDDSSTIDGAIHARDDLTINGSGSLSVEGQLHGIVCKDDLKILGSLELNVTSTKIGLQAGDSLRIGETPSITINSGHDGIQVSNDELNSYFYMESGSLDITAGYDGIDVDTDATSGTFTGSAKFVGGSVKAIAGGGSSYSKSSSTSKKGIVCKGDLQIGAATLDINSADDSIHSNACISIASATITAQSSDDGVHADSTLSITSGTITVTKSYEGLEAYIIDISGGDISVNASDDGLNCAGGNDTQSTSDYNPWGGTSSTGTLYIKGGNIYVNAQGDGLDSNGSIYVSGGTTIVEGPTDGGNGAIDKGDGGSYVAEITGGTVLAIGSTGMAVNFDSGTQCSGLVALSGGSGTIITVEDGSGFSFTASKTFACAVYSSPSMSKGNSYAIKADSRSATMNFSSSYYYSNVSGTGGGPVGPGR